MSQRLLLYEARKQAVWSYLHKLTLMAIACIGFGAVHWLGNHTTWEAGKTVHDVVRTAVEKAISSQGAAGDGSAASATAVVKPDIACVDVPDPTRTFETRDQLIAAMQDRAEACVWATFGRAGRLAGGCSGKPDAAQCDAARPSAMASSVASEQILVGVTARAARQIVLARLTSMPLPLHDDPAKGRGPKSFRAWLGAQIRKAAVPESGARVLLEMLTFACLLMGVVATSILVIIVLTALPITSAEGYWTDRIGKLLDKLASSSPGLLAVPIAAAAIGSGAVATYHVPNLQRITHSAPVSTTTKNDGSSTTNDNRSYRYGDNYPGPDPAGLINSGPVTNSLYEIDQSARTISLHTADLSTSFAESVGPVTVKIDELTTELKQRDADMARLGAAIEGLRADLKQAIPSSAHEVRASVDKVQESVAEAKQAVADAQHEVVAAVNEVGAKAELQRSAIVEFMGQGAQTDRRDLRHRIFGPTLYQVGPAVPTIIHISVQNVETEKVAMAVENALKAMWPQTREPLSKEKFLEALKMALGNRPELKDKVDELLEHHQRAILKACALSKD